MNRYTVLLLRPDYVADGFGEDTYLAHVRAETPKAAITLAQQKVAGLDDIMDYYAHACSHREQARGPSQR